MDDTQVLWWIIGLAATVGEEPPTKEQWMALKDMIHVHLDEKLRYPAK
jgi:hypothetical protein